MNVHLRFTAIAAVVVLVMWEAPSLAQDGASSTAAQSSANPLAAQRKAFLDAQANLNSLKAQVAQIRLTIQATFDSNDDWIAAKKALADAKAKYDAALKPVVDKLHASADYQQLVEHRKAAQAKLDELRTEPQAVDSQEQKTQDDALSQAAGDVLNDGFALNKMERDARDNDPALATAKEELSDAQKAMDGLQAQVTAALQGDSGYQSAQTQLTAAIQALAAARADLIAAQKAQRPVSTPPRETTSSPGGYR